MIKMAEKQTAGRDYLGKLAPKFAELNDDVLFGEVWAREDKLLARDRSMITIAALFSAGLYPQLKSHLELGKKHGITKEEAVEIVTQLAFYCGWPKAWSTFPLIEEGGLKQNIQKDRQTTWGNDDLCFYSLLVAGRQGEVLVHVIAIYLRVHVHFALLQDKVHFL
ncbi:hypothetical protein NRIC0767_03940 [Lactobacillus delbrueckii subsp. allosunkii]|nr:hypothetical protein NRIC0766_00100 [Lactobacillus delbrueckii subsp. sunkii]GHN14133.1 hypothetical protein NRIC0767_03940 [Lactobacillus delbrueckii subsp. sunkii]